MSTERRFSEAEIAAILEHAAHAQQRAHRGRHHDGLTLEELQEAGRDAGIDPAYIARAAAAVERAAPAVPPVRILGQQVSVAHSIELPGPFTDADWDALVQDLRGTFVADGEVNRRGDVRQWKNGNLRAEVEPTADGHRLRLRSLNQKLRDCLVTGPIALGFGLLFLTLYFVLDKPDPVPGLIMSTLMNLLGLGLLGRGLFALPGWRQDRERQMRDIAERALDRAERSLDRAALPRVSEAPPIDLDALPDEAEDISTRADARRRTT